MRHRGPDSQGSRVWEDAGLVHTRLSILDLSDSGSQPMANESGTIWTVFNGEIYNHRSLRGLLQQKGHEFVGRSDTEVLPHLYEEEGREMLCRLKGMFAIALLDTRAKRLLLVRDRFGIKPLFYAQVDQTLIFSSEIAALRRFPGVNLSPDEQAIHDYAALLYVPSPSTVFQGIRSVEPGHYLEAQLGPEGLTVTRGRYHQWMIAPDPGLTLSGAVEEAGRLLHDGVQRQLESDVPLGALLSGGIDSSLVSAVAQEGSAQQLRTFNVSFDEAGYDETWAARAVSDHIGSEHQTLAMSEAPGTWDSVSDLLKHVGQPYADTSIFAAHAVCRLMRRHVTVALSGDGGDEGFGGYNCYWQAGILDRFQRLPRLLQRGAVWGMRPAGWLRLVPPQTGSVLREVEGRDPVNVVQSLLSWIRGEEHRRLCRNRRALPIRRLFEPVWDYRLSRDLGARERVVALLTEACTRLVLANDYLVKVDVASMAESLEVRVPMLDEDLFAFALTLPCHLKVRSRATKIILRELARRSLPPAVAEKAKHGFGVPVHSWVGPSFRARLQETLLSDQDCLPGFFDRDVYEPWISAFCGGGEHRGVSQEGLYQRVIMLLSLHLTFKG